MSRNKEKSQSGLHRYYNRIVNEATGNFNFNERPKRTLEVKLLSVAELCRRAIIAQFLAKLSEINNPLIKEEEIRDLNITLGELDKEKLAWEHHIVLLGGTNHINHSRRIGINVNGLWYYGRGKSLPEAKKKNVGNKKSISEGATFDSDYFNLPQSLLKIPDNINIIFEELEAPKLAVEANTSTKPFQTHYTNRDVERWLVEKKRIELLKEVENLM